MYVIQSDNCTYFIEKSEDVHGPTFAHGATLIVRNEDAVILKYRRDNVGYLKQLQEWAEKNSPTQFPELVKIMDTAYNQGKNYERESMMVRLGLIQKS